jgi:heme exporter protein C
MKKIWPWLLWLWISAVIVGAFAYAPPAEGFIGKSDRILFFHVPMAWASFVGFVTAGVWSALYLFGRRDSRRDRSALAAVALGLVFGILATITGAMWSKTMWGAYWNWDPRQTSIVFALLFYAAYLALRGGVEDRETSRRLAAAYAVLGLVVAPFLFFVAPRLPAFSLHPQPVINTSGKVEMDNRMLQVLIGGFVGFTALFFWLHSLARRILALREAE